MRRKRISDRTKLAATLLARGDIPYDHAKLMTEDQIISLYQFDHNIRYETEHEDRDKFWNLAPLLIRTHRAKTKLDLREIAKSKRLRKANEQFKKTFAMLEAFQREENEKIIARVFNKGVRKLRSRGFDKTRRRKMSGEVVKR
jgi:predicted ATP-binding protein involved in virulence